MDYRNLFISLAIILGMAVSINFPTQGLFNDNQQTTSYIDHDPIFIDGNTHFRATVIAKNWFGDGSESTPYVIDRLHIIGPRSSNLIEIRNTDLHFKINNCILSGGNGGIFLSNVKNGIISYNNISKNICGISLNYSTNNIISWDTITHNLLEGIFLDSSRNSTLSDNIIRENLWTGVELWNSGNSNLSDNLVTNNNGSGIILGRSRGCFISSNNVSSNKYTGIKLLDSESCILLENFIVHNNLNGISFGNASNAKIFNNVVLSNRWFGIRIYDSSRNIFTNNTLSNNHRYGILLESSSEDNKVIQNDFIGNYGVDYSQAFDDGENNEFVYNYWDEWTSPDTNADGVVDLSYLIDGNAGNQDTHPLVSQYLIISRTSDRYGLNTIIGLILLIITLSALIVLLFKQKSMRIF